ncbi:MAG: hypothetical protein G01um101416_648 [Microgenomates group bacterium Gr01-1014_16]|nr:MAG: hypothetical protein G01um101416_648 [Microgenomates group bacterium Gr01-1014_16]
MAGKTTKRVKAGLRSWDETDAALARALGIGEEEPYVAQIDVQEDDKARTERIAAEQKLAGENRWSKELKRAARRIVGPRLESGIITEVIAVESGSE